MTSIVEPAAPAILASAPPTRAVTRTSRWSLPGLVRSRILRTMATLALVALVWFGFAPKAIGGSDSYAVANGISMLPRFHEGDLVILRAQPTYHVGEIAGYHNRQLGVVVMHRIIAIHGNRYVFRGDNNNFTDSYHPTKSQIVGAEWIHVPRLGEFVEVARVPTVAAVLLAILWIASFSHDRPNRHRRHRRHSR